MQRGSPQRLFGLGLRQPHYADFLHGSPEVDFVEVISENFMIDGGRPLFTLEQVRARYPVALHGVSMSLGSPDGLRGDYLRRLRQLADRIQPLFVSDHLCWTHVDGFNSHDLLPVPYTEEALAVVCTNVLRAQDALERQMLIENPSSYMTFNHSTMTEWDFLKAVCAVTGCGVLLDINNIFVSAINHGFDAYEYLDAVSDCPVQQMHLAGHDDSGEIIIDTHDREVCPRVWDLYAAAAERFPLAATMIERDDDIPPLADLLAEVRHAQALAADGARVPLCA